ncbi:MAG: T9SS type A sorting domain-containing protein [Candidatus Latescibacteria bacterium]|nr:T9SS type A sorting domain-containing protein [Candidatus Latescibacterota bacterium]NIO57260.1 T9SS type A sorting domain-containing protein [Candidatus Latescibacterota bacterium]
MSISATESEGKIKISRSYGPIGLHYQSVDGVDYLVSNIFELGEPVVLSPEEPPVVLDDGDSPPSEELPSDVPKVTEITSIYPNPFNPSITIRFALVTSGRVSLRIYDARGVLIRTLLGESLPSGVHEVLWDGRDHRGQHVASGIYFAHLVAGDVRTVRKMVMLK